MANKTPDKDRLRKLMAFAVGALRRSGTLDEVMKSLPEDDRRALVQAAALIDLDEVEKRMATMSAEEAAKLYREAVVDGA